MSSQNLHKAFVQICLRANGKSGGWVEETPQPSCQVNNSPLQQHLLLMDPQISGYFFLKIEVKLQTFNQAPSTRQTPAEALLLYNGSAAL